MKPKNRIYCRESRKLKILFETGKKADTFIKFNAEEIQQETGRRPVRSYFCICCGGYHVTSKVQDDSKRSRSEVVLETYEECRKMNREGRARMKEIKRERTLLK